MSDCNKFEFKGVEYTRAQFKQAVLDGKIIIPNIDGTLANDNTTQVAHDISGTFKYLPFKFSDSQINKDSIVVLPETYNTGTYKSYSNSLYNLTYMGGGYIGQYLHENGITIDQFNERVLNASKIPAFMSGAKSMGVYKVSKVDSADDIIPEIDDPRYAKLYARQLAIAKSIKGQLKSEQNPSKREDLYNRLHVAQSQAESLLSPDTRTFNTVINNMENDLNIASKILESVATGSSNTDADEKALSYANSLVYNYVQIINTNFAENIDAVNDTPLGSRILKLLTQADKIGEQIGQKTVNMGNQIMTNLTGKNQLKVNGLIVDGKDYHKNVTYVRNIEENPNPIVQALSKMLNAALNTLNHIIVSFKHINNNIVSELKKYQKQHGVNDVYDYMIQKDKSGKRTEYTVDRQTAEYYSLRATAYNKGTNEYLKFLATNNNFVVNNDVWDKVKARIINDRKHIISSDITLNAYDELNGITLEQKIQDAAERYAELQNPYEVKGILDRAASNFFLVTPKEKEQFENFLKFGWREELIDGKWVRALEYTAKDEWIDPRWEAIQKMSKDDPRKVFYNHYMDHIIKGRRALEGEDNHLPYNFIPEKIKQLGIIDNVKNIAYNHMTQNISQNRGHVDPVTNEISKKIPTYMLNHNLSAENKNYDLGAVLEDWVHEYTNYQEKSKIEDQAHLLLNLIKKQPVPNLNPDGSIKMKDDETVDYKIEGATNNYLQAAYAINAMVYGEIQDVEIPTNKKLLHSEIKESMKKIKEQVDNLKLSDSELDEATNYVSIGEPYIGTNDKVREYVQLANKYKNLQAQGRNITGSKVINSLLYMTSIKMLAINPFAGIGEFLQALTAITFEGAGGRFFNDTHVFKSIGMMFAGTIPGSMANKINNNINRYFGCTDEVIHESEARLEGKSGTIPFIFYKLANRWGNTNFTKAMLMNTKVKDKNGKEWALLDNHGDEQGHWGALNISDDGIFSWNKDIDIPLMEDGKPTKYILDLIEKSNMILRLNRDRQTFKNPTQIDRSIIGRVLGQFKKSWLIEGFYYRFGDHKEATELVPETEGYYRTLLNLFRPPLVKDPISGVMVRDFSPSGIGRMISNIVSTFLKFTIIGRKTGMLKEDEFSEMDRVNLAKCMREFTAIITLGIIMVAVSSGGGNDDKEPLRIYLVNQMIRLHRDFTQYCDPNSLASILKNPMPLVSSMSDYWDIVNATCRSGILMDPYTNKGDLRIQKAVEKNLPYWNQVHKMYNRITKKMIYSNY